MIEITEVECGINNWHVPTSLSGGKLNGICTEHAKIYYIDPKANQVNLTKEVRRVNDAAVKSMQILFNQLVDFS